MTMDAVDSKMDTNEMLEKMIDKCFEMFLRTISDHNQDYSNLDQDFPKSAE